MRSYFAKQNNSMHPGGWITIMNWRKIRIKLNSAPVKTYIARANEKHITTVA